MSRKRYYKWCFVPQCANTTASTPGKKFMTVPKDETRRKAWFQAVGRDVPKSVSSNYFCCEDHFTLQEDVGNYYYHCMIGGPIKMKSSVVPHIFKNCSDQKGATSTPSCSLVEEKQYNLQEINNISEEKTTSSYRKSFNIEPLLSTSRQQIKTGILEESIDENSLMNSIIMSNENGAVKPQTVIEEVYIKVEPTEFEYEHVEVKNEFEEIESGDNFASKSADVNDSVVSKNSVKDLREQHFGIKNVTNKDFLVPKKLKTFSQHKKHVCDVCNKSFKIITHLKIHKRVHTGERPFKCDLCKRAFTQFSYLNIHKRIHTGEKPFKCDVCNQRFTQSGHVIQHKKTCEKPFKCEVCNKTFSQAESLALHTKIHTAKGKPYECSVCDKAFGTYGQLHIHIRIHTGEKPYECEICSKAFAASGQLNRHKRVHTGEKPFECDICNKAFTQSGDMKLHRRIHTGEKPFRCDVCNKPFSTSGNLSIHMKIHTGEKPYTCSICELTFTQSAHVSSHKKCAHK